MARLVHECNLGMRNENYTTNGLIFCTPDKQYCCNQQCCLIQRRPTRQLWETWYFWLGLALLAFFVLASVSSYLLSSCNFHASAFGSHAGRPPNGSGGNIPADNANQISINVIATPEAPLSSHRKMILIAPRASLTRMTPVVA